MADDDRQGWRSPALAVAIHQVETELETAWSALLRDLDVAPGTPDETELCRIVADDPSAYDWRVVDAALARIAEAEGDVFETPAPNQHPLPERRSVFRVLE